jgi:outer membrane receptor protein involved in Fe transport
MPTLTFDIVNLTNTERRAYFQFPNATFTSYKPGRTYALGLRMKF